MIKGYKMAALKAKETLEEFANKVDINDEAILQKIAMVSMGSKNVGDDNTKMELGKMVIKAVKQVMEKNNSGKIVVDHDFIKVEKKAGGNVSTLHS